MIIIKITTNKCKIRLLLEIRKQNITDVTTNDNFKNET